MNRCGRVSCCFLFSPGPFFDGFVGDFLFTFLQLLKEEAAPAAVVCRNVFPALGVVFQGFHIPFTHVLIPQLWPALWSFANGKFSIEDVLRYSAILRWKENQETTNIPSKLLISQGKPKKLFAEASDE